MSHKEKLCEPALASHIEVCHEQCTYTPLIISRRMIPVQPVAMGLPALVNSEVNDQLNSRLNEVNEQTQNYLKRLKDDVNKAFEAKTAKAKSATYNTQKLKDVTIGALELEAEMQMERMAHDIKKEIQEESDGRYDLRNPERAIDARLGTLREELIKKMDKDLGDFEINTFQSYELDGLGMFFKEAVCYRSEGLTYSPCGEEFSILPGEKINESNVLKTAITQEDTKELTITENLTTKDSNEETETFSNSYDRTVKKETDIKLASEASFKLGIPFKKIKLDLSSKRSSSINFKKVITEVNKSAHTLTQKRFHEVVRNLNVKNSTKSTRKESINNEISFNRTWENKTDKTLHYIKRKSFCKTSVIHKRLNVHLAWSGCIEDPGRDLCTPDNLEDKNAARIQEIRDRWQTANPPTSLGSRPTARKVCTNVHRGSNSLAHIGQSNFSQSFQYTIPSGWTYAANSASVDVGYHSSTVMDTEVQSQPSGGATGGVQFRARVRLKNIGLKKEEVDFKVCFNILPAAAADWDAQVEQWREEQAQLEIDAFLERETERLTQFLASDQARAAVERRIMEKYFGITNITDCCKLIARLRDLFDFDQMCYSLLPAWNELGEGCQRSNPVNLYTAKCLHFYLPINPGAELEAIALLNSVNAIPWSPSVAIQVLQYVQAIINMRNTLYNRLFDPTGWDVKFDQPLGYQMTPFDTTNTDWESAHESELNYELVGAFALNVPIGERIDCRPSLCCDE